MATPTLLQLLSNPSGGGFQPVDIQPIAVNPGQMVQAPQPPVQQEQGGAGQSLLGLASMFSGGETGPTLDAAGILNELPSSGVPVGIAKPELIQQEKDLLGLNTFEGYNPLATGINGQSGVSQLPLFMQQ